MTTGNRSCPNLASALPSASAIAMVLICAFAVAAQSGRHLPKSSPTPSPTPEATPEKKPHVEKEAVSLRLIVGIERYSTTGYIPLHFYDSVLSSCVDRLNDSRSVEVEIVEREMNRGAAVQRAKGETEAYVVWLQLQPDIAGVDRGTSGNLNDLYVEYSVFEPKTAKQAAWGRSYQKSGRRGVIPVPTIPGRPTVTYTEYLLQEAAREAAERILSALHVALPPKTIPS